jgi:glycosyltransferase involved in cell wall biosynthesis
MWLLEFVKALHVKNKNIFISPIIDSSKSSFFYKLVSFLGIERHNIYSSPYVLRRINPFVKGIFVRSDYEKIFFIEALGYSANKVLKVPLSCSSNLDFSLSGVKENFCLHVSSIYQSRKNVVRLIEAAKKFNFNLVLAGSCGTEKDFLPIKNAIGYSKNIKVLGFITDEELKELYLKAKVFSLPSIIEGVGIVALDAAGFGCEIVITDIGGPKEYYDSFASIINPFDINEIGAAIDNILKGNNCCQPNLKEHILENYSNKAITSLLIENYKL